MQLSGVYTCLTTPFDHLGNIYIPKVQYNIGRLDHTTLAGYVVGGVEGEGALLSADERIKLWEETKAAGSEKTVFPAVEAASVRETVDLIRRAADLGFEAALVQLAADGSSRLTPADACAPYLRSVADRSPLPLILSWDAGAADQRIPAEQCASLGEHSKVAGLRLVTDDLAYFRDCLQACGDGVDVMIGSATLLARALACGAAGAMIGFANAAPYLCLSIEEAVRTRELEAAEDLQTLANPAIEAIRKYGVAGLKYAADLRGYYGGPPRLPLAQLTPGAKTDIENALRDIKS